MSKNLQKLIYCGLSIVAALFTIIALSYPLIVNTGYGNFSFVTTSENGFDLLRFYSDIFLWDWAITLVGILCLFQLLVSIAIILLNVFSFFKCSENNVKKISLCSIIICFILNIMYMIEGIIIAATFGNSYAYYTLTYIAFIVNFGFTSGYYIFYYYDKKIFVSSDSVIKVFPQVSNTYNSFEVIKNSETEKENIELLIKYKELLDKGIITQDEFNEKKKEFLDL